MEIKDFLELGNEGAIAHSLKMIEETRPLHIVTASLLKPQISSKGSLQVPYIAKDNLATLELTTTASSKILEGFTSPYEATVITKLKAAGAMMVAKSNMDEFAMGSSTENSALFTTLNPLDPTRVPGGSSGGSAAAVAAKVVPFALGSDTGGSIRQPAAFCGVVGMMPSYGRVSRYGLLAMASSLDRIGTFTHTVADAAKVLSVISGKDEMDATSVDLPVPNYVSELTGDVKGLKVGVPTEYFGEGVEEGVATAVRSAIEQLRSLGAEIMELSLPHTHYALATYYIIQPAEVSSNLARYDGIRYGFSTVKDPHTLNLMDTYVTSRTQGFGEEVRRRIMLGTYTLSAGFRDAYYDKAQRIRTLIKQDFDKAFETVDVIVAPTTPTVAFKVGERTQDPLAMYKADMLTTPASLAGLPGISIPCGLSDGMPVGLQIIGKLFDESTVLRTADAYERSMK